MSSGAQRTEEVQHQQGGGKVCTRRIAKIYTATVQKEGAGFMVNRPFPSREVTDEQTDPFLMLDEFGPKAMDLNSPGAPWHPHRGFDAVTYMKAGLSAHQDSLGNKGLIKTGEVQWMRTGSGIIHDEGPPKHLGPDELKSAGYREGAVAHGFQLWVNLPPELKMASPSYHHLTQDTFKWMSLGPRAEAKVFAGDISSDTQLRQSPLSLSMPVLYADVVVTMPPVDEASDVNQPTVIPMKEEFNTCILYIYDGEGRVYDGDGDEAGTLVKKLDAVLYQYPTAGTQIKVVATSQDRGLKFMLMGGRRIGAPVARYGPFVMTTEEEIMQAMEDYRNGKLATVKGTDSTY